MSVKCVYDWRWVSQTCRKRFPYDETATRFDASHFRLLDPKASIDKQWRVVVLLLNRKKDELPIGKILVSQEVRDAILPPDAA